MVAAAILDYRNFKNIMQATSQQQKGRLKESRPTAGGDWRGDL